MSFHQPPGQASVAPRHGHRADLPSPATLRDPRIAEQLITRRGRTYPEVATAGPLLPAYDVTAMYFRILTGGELLDEWCPKLSGCLRTLAGGWVEPRGAGFVAAADKRLVPLLESAWLALKTMRDLEDAHFRRPFGANAALQPWSDFSGVPVEALDQKPRPVGKDKPACMGLWHLLTSEQLVRHAGHDFEVFCARGAVVHAVPELLERAFRAQGPGVHERLGLHATAKSETQTAALSGAVHQKRAGKERKPRARFDDWVIEAVRRKLRDSQLEDVADVRDELRRLTAESSNPPSPRAIEKRALELYRGYERE